MYDILFLNFVHSNYRCYCFSGCHVIVFYSTDDIMIYFTYFTVRYFICLW